MRQYLAVARLDPISIRYPVDDRAYDVSCCRVTTDSYSLPSCGRRRAWLRRRVCSNWEDIGLLSAPSRYPLQPLR